MKRSLLTSWSAAAYLAALTAPALTVSVADAQTPLYPPGGSGGGGSGTVTSVTCPNAVVTVSGNCFPIAAGGTSGDIIVASGTSGNATDSGIALTSGVTAGQLLIGNGTSGKFQAATLTQGTNVTITNGNGTITIASSGGGNVTGCEAPGSVLDAILLDAAANGNCTAMAAVGATGTLLTGQGAGNPPLFKAGAFVLPPSAGAKVDPTAPANTTTYFMQGISNLSGNTTITPTRSGVTEMIISGRIAGNTTTTGDGIGLRLYYGTGTPPANAAALTGTQCTATTSYLNPTTIVAADVNVPFTLICIANLTVGTAYWWDIAAESFGTASSGKINAVYMQAIEF